MVASFSFVCLTPSHLHQQCCWAIEFVCTQVSSFISSLSVTLQWPLCGTQMMRLACLTCLYTSGGHHSLFHFNTGRFRWSCQTRWLFAFFASLLFVQFKLYTAELFVVALQMLANGQIKSAFNCSFWRCDCSTQRNVWLPLTVFVCFLEITGQT